MSAFGTQTIVVLLAVARPGILLKNASNRFLVFSLKTHVVREVEVLAHRLTWRSTLAFDYARGVANMETGLMERVLSELVRFEIAAVRIMRAPLHLNAPAWKHNWQFSGNKP
ncbi:hypothetical protein [Leisingera sp. NJS204]|uniref:hypothetical protein n=1 Tax=Leisingera sp. NJS204 TaxID=2508307 RepID=UPI0013E921A5|nr:hypothetical protein [Leisingera sp. NJS204]